MKSADESRAAAVSPGTQALERDLAVLVRGLEELYRSRRYPLERAHYLLLLRLLEGAASSGELAAALSLDHSTVTRQVAALERDGHVERHPNPADGRSVLIAATPAGRQRCLEMQELRRNRLEQMLADWRDDERQHFAALVGRFNEAVMEAGRARRGAARRGAAG